jgi:hypothetical protein
MPCQSRTRNAKRDNKENTENDNDADEEDGSDLGVLGLAEFLDALTRQDDNLRLEARIDTSSVSGTCKEKADAIATLIWAA